MFRNSSLFLVACVALLAAACSDDNNTVVTPDSTNNKDAGGKPDARVVDPLSCDNDCNDFVISKITLPDSTTATQVGWDYDGDGTPDNTLGSILGALSTMADSLNVQESVNTGVNSGDTLVLLRLQADDFANDATAKAQGWTGTSTQCCSNPAELEACATEAQSTCFGGSTTFTPASDAPDDAVFDGKIEASAMQMGPSTLRFVLPFAAGKLTLNLKGVYLLGKVAADGKSISDGILAGAIGKTDLDNNVIPNIAQMLNATLTDPETEKTVKENIESMFDANKDGSITKEEVAGNMLIQTFLGGDVDVDGDGELELSLGVGFDAVSCVIDDGGSTSDAGPQADAAPDAAPDAAIGE